MENLILVIILYSLAPLFIFLAILFHLWSKKVKYYYKSNPDETMKYLKKLNNRKLVQQKISEIAFTVIGCFFILSGAGILVIQSYTYLKYGFWKEYSLLALMDFGAGKELVDELKSPRDWIGFHKILYNIFNHLPLSLVLIVVGSLFLNAAEK